MLTTIEGRVIGCLLEKERTTPDQYPLTLNALVLACNQSSSREPVMHLDDHEVEAVLSALKTQGLLRYVHPAHGRSVTRYRQIADQSWGLEPPAAAVIAVLLLRGPQTVAELRIRTERLHPFDSPGALESALHELASAGTVQLLERQSGQKEWRWQQLLAEETEPIFAALFTSAAVTGLAVTGVAVNGVAVSSSIADRVAQLEARVARLESALSDLLPDEPAPAAGDPDDVARPAPIPAELAIESFGPEQ